MSAEQVEAKTLWVWTDEAVRRNLFQNIEANTPVWETIKREHHDAGWLKELFGKHKQRIFLKVRPNLIFNVRWICSENHIYS